jgi:DNA polymerase III subunit gamma/tau
VRCDIRLAKRHRPHIFEDVIGQDTFIRLLKAIINSDSLEAAYLFSGPTGVGKTTLGRIFAQTILCDSPVNSNPCGKCESCLLFQKDQHYGYREIDAASCGGKDDMVKLRDESTMLSTVKRKILLIDECQDITPQGQDALLKQVEECPEHLIYIFCTSDPDKMKKTLRNRCMEFQVSRVGASVISGRLKQVCDIEKIEYDQEGLDAIAYKADGHVRNALNFIEQTAFLGKVTIDNIDSIFKDVEQDVFEVLSNIGVDVDKALQAGHKVSTYLAAADFYDSLTSLVGDSCKYLYGYQNFSPRRVKFLEQLKDVHGFSLLEFLNYLLTRDKFIDRIGLASDILVMHYKFTSGGMVPKVVISSPVVSASNSPSEPKVLPVAEPEPAKDALTYSTLSKMGVKEKSETLRRLKQSQTALKKQDESEIVPAQWPLPKEERLGESNKDEEELTPQEFSQRLVGGRGGGL